MLDKGRTKKAAEIFFFQSLSLPSAILMNLLRNNHVPVDADIISADLLGSIVDMHSSK